MDILHDPSVTVTRVCDPDYPDDVFVDITFGSEATVELFNQVGDVLMANVDGSDQLHTTRMQTRTTFKVKDEYVVENERRRAQAQIHIDNIRREMTALRELGMWPIYMDNGYTTPLEWRKDIVRVTDTCTGKYELECRVGSKLHTALLQHGLIE